MWRNIHLEESARSLGEVSCRKPITEFCSVVCQGLIKEGTFGVSTWVCWSIMNQHNFITTEGTSFSHPLLHSGGNIRKKLLDHLRNKEVVMAGHGRHDSLGQFLPHMEHAQFSLVLLAKSSTLSLCRVFQFSVYYCHKRCQYLILHMGNEAKRI